MLGFEDPNSLFRSFNRWTHHRRELGYRQGDSVLLILFAANTAELADEDDTWKLAPSRLAQPLADPSSLAAPLGALNGGRRRRASRR